MSTTPEHITHWPTSYGTGQRTARDARGHLHAHFINVPEDSLELFAQNLLDKFPEDGPLGKPTFMIEFRGTKTAYSFDFKSAEDRHIVFEKYLEKLDLDGVEADNHQNWYIDIGVELSRPGYVFQWRTDAHSTILRHACPHVTEARAQRITSGSGNYHRDVSAHLFSLSGFRFSPSQPIDDVSHVNVYTTDKTPFYQIHTGVFRPRSAEDLLPKKIEKLLNDIDEISVQFSACAGVDSEPQDGAARLEVRVGIDSALTALGQFDDNDLETTIIQYPDEVWW